MYLYNKESIDTQEDFSKKIPIFQKYQSSFVEIEGFNFGISYKELKSIYSLEEFHEVFDYIARLVELKKEIPNNFIIEGFYLEYLRVIEGIKANKLAYKGKKRKERT